MKRIDVFMPPLSQYGVLHHFTKKMHEALQSCGVNSRLLEAKRNDPGPFLDALFQDPPECTLSFNGLLPDDQGRFFSEMIRIPHIACLVDSPYSYLSLIRSPYSIITCADRGSVDFFRGVGFKNVTFMPHGIESSLAPDPNATREYDVVMLGSFIDFEGIRASWKHKFPPALCQAMDKAVELALNDQFTPYYQIFVQALNEQVTLQQGLDPQTIDFLGVLDEIEMYIRGKDRFELINAIKDAKVDIFGSADGQTGWGKYLGHKRNIIIHDPVPFEQALAIMKHSKIVLNSCPWIKDGGHERIFAGLACGALVITNDNVYMHEQFKDGESIVLYQQQKWDKANHRVNEYLENNSKRKQIVERGRELVMKNHTWEKRAQNLLHELPALLASVRQATANA